MILLWHFYWPVIVTALLVGFTSGMIFQRNARVDSHERLAGLGTAIDDKLRYRKLVLAGGIGISLAFAALWHGPLGAGERLSSRIEANARAMLEHFEMEVVSARVERSPLRRRLVLSGPGDEVQQRELVRIMSDIPGISEVRWDNPPAAPVWMK